MAANYRETAVRKILVSKQRLAQALEANLSKHKQEYLEAIAGYAEARRHAYAELSTAAALASSEDNEQARRRARLAYKHLHDLDVPCDHSESYNQAIALMEWETRDVIELSINDFECYVRDRWDWKQDFESNYVNYAG